MTSIVHAHRRRRRGVLATTFVPLIALAPSASAQRVVSSVELGGSVMRYADSVDASAASISPTLRVDGDRLTLGAGGTLSQLARGWSTQGGLSSSLFTPAAGVLVGEVSGFAGGTAQAGGARTGQALGVARAHVMAATLGAWIGAGAGTTWDGGAWHPVRTAEVGAWRRAGALTALATATPTAVSDTIRYVDAELALRFDFRRADLGFAGGARTGDRVPSSRGSESAWGSVSAAAWLTPGAAVVASIGSYPIDFTQGFPGGRFVSLGVRFGQRTSHGDAGRRDTRRPLAPIDHAASLPVAATPDGVLALRLSGTGAGGRTIRIHAPQAAAVEVMGDFTDWTPTRLAPDGTGWWTATFPLGPGTYGMNVRVNDGRWLVPPGLTSVEDEFGGSVGLLVVP